MSKPSWDQRTVQALGSNAALLFAVALIIAWLPTFLLVGSVDTWQLLINTTTTIITFLMAFVILRGQNRDTAALQAKLDTIIAALPEASDKMIRVESEDPKTIEDLRP